MRDPERWLEHADLPDELRRALERSKTIAAPGEDTRARVLCGVLGSAAAAAALSGTLSSSVAKASATTVSAAPAAGAGVTAGSGVAATTGSAAVTAAATGGTSLSLKIVALALAGSGAIAAGTTIHRARQPEQTQDSQRPQVQQVQIHAPVAPPPPPTSFEAAPATEIEEAAPAALPEPTPAPRNDRGSATGLPASAERRPGPTRTEAQVEIPGESELIGQARANVHAGDFSEALEVIGRAQSLYAAGTLQQERELLRIRALQGQGRMLQARHHAQDFVARYPDSPYAAKLSAELLSAKGPEPDDPPPR